MRTALLASVICVGACVRIDGGAVELGWAIRNERGNLSCSAAGIETVTLIDEDPAGDTLLFDFACEDGRGSTAFQLVPGQHLFRIEPAGPGADDVAVPNPIVARVREGEVTDLQVLVIRAP